VVSARCHPDPASAAHSCRIAAKSEELPGAADIGLTHKQIHEARQIRDAEQAQPGVIRQILD
jgi:hypothetical protein